ncbi:MAG: FAD-dependent oxidoreductase [Pseudomonadota bacterium]
MTEHYNVVIIGGGIHGAGVAQAAACAGYSVLLIEKTGLAAGSSSRSSKLIHGGLRYLEGLDFSLVHESLRERTLLLRIAPELVRLQPFHIPVYPQTSRRPLTIRAGLTLYAILGRLHRDARFRKLKQRDWDKLDGLTTDRLQAVYRYFDAQTDDVQLTRAVMQSAINLGAVLRCPAGFLGASINPQGCEVRYRDNASDGLCTADVIVNAAGPWASDIDRSISPVPRITPVDLVQGAHLILSGVLNHGCYYLEVPSDRRAVFMLPWGEHTMLGTTETLYSGAPEHVQPLPVEETYLLDTMQHYFPDRPQQVIDRFAGLRVLPAAQGIAFGRSRETRLPVDNARQPRLVSIYGGKLTGYRATAVKVVRILGRTLPARKPVADTARLVLRPV